MKENKLLSDLGDITRFSVWASEARWVIILIPVFSLEADVMK